MKILAVEQERHHCLQEQFRRMGILDVSSGPEPNNPAP
jgi:hypothetical protein